MEDDLHCNVQDVRLSGGQSFGSNYHRCSQSRKMSIGIAAESIGIHVKRNHTLVAQRGEIYTGTKNGMNAYQTRSMTRNTYKVNEGRSSQPESPMKRTSFLDLSRNAKGAHGIQATGDMKEPVTTSKAEPRDGKMEKPSYGKENLKVVPPKGGLRNSQMAETNCLQVHDSSNRDNPLEKSIKEALRMKLHKILGTKAATDMPNIKYCPIDEETNVPDKPEAISTTNKQSNETQQAEEETSVVNLEAPLEENQPADLRQDSDTIESDSENSPQTARRKRPMAKARPKSLSQKLSYENDENHAFYFKEKNFGAYFAATTGRRSMFKGNKNETKSHMIRMTKLAVPLNDRSNIPQVVSETKQPSLVEEISLCGGKASAHRRPCQLQPNRVLRKDSYSIPAQNEYDNQGSLCSQATPKFKRNENCAQKFPPTSGNLRYDLHSSETVLNTRAQVPSLSPVNHVNEIKRQSFKCMLAARNICFDDLLMYESVLRKRQHISRSNDRTSGSGKAVASAPSQHMRKRDSKDTPEGKDNSPEIVYDDEEVIHERKRVCAREVVEDGQSCRSLSYLNGRGSNGRLEHDQEDCLDGDIAEFGHALDRVKDKLVLSTKMKCAEILASTAEEMYSKLQSARSQVEKDVGKLTSLSISRKQFLEKRFKEKQEQLRLIHDKFREEISQHLEEFSRVMENLHVERSELKGVIERQKVFHQKLLLQMEEAFENHLSDAQKRMAAVHEAVRLRMLQLKTGIDECFKEGLFA